MNPIDNHDSYDQLFVTGAPRSPGVFRLTAAPDVNTGWEKKEGKGAEGGETINNGRKLAEFEGEFYLWRDANRDCFAEWESFKVVFAQTTKDGPLQKALDVYHPVLDEAGITSVVMRNVPVAVPDGKGGAVVKLKFLEYRPTKKRVGTGKPKGGDGTHIDLTGGGSKPVTNAALKAENAQLDVVIKKKANP